MQVSVEMIDLLDICIIFFRDGESYVLVPTFWFDW